MLEYTDKEIIQGIIQQDENVLRFMYTEYFSSVKKMVRKYGGSNDDAWDLFQDSMSTLIDILEIKGESFHVSSSFKTFFVELSKRIWMKSFRNVDNKLVFNSEIVDEAIDFSEEMAADLYFENALLRAYFRNLKLLKPSCRKILRLLENERPSEVMLNRMKLSSTQSVYNKKRACIKKLITLINEDPLYKNLIKHGKP